MDQDRGKRKDISVVLPEEIKFWCEVPKRQDRLQNTGSKDKSWLVKPLKNNEKQHVSIKGAVRGYKTPEATAVLQDEEGQERQSYWGLWIGAYQGSMRENVLVERKIHR